MKYNHLLSLAVSLMVLVLVCYSTPAGGQKKSDVKGPELQVYLPNFVRPHPPGSPAPMMKSGCPPTGGILHAWLDYSDDPKTATMKYYIEDMCGGTDFTPNSPNPHSLATVSFDSSYGIKFCTEGTEVRVTGKDKNGTQATKVTKCDQKDKYDVSWN